MFLTISVIMLVMWVLGLVSGAPLGAWVHLLLAISLFSGVLSVATEMKPLVRR